MQIGSAIRCGGETKPLNQEPYCRRKRHFRKQ